MTRHEDPVEQLRKGGIYIDGQLYLSSYMVSVHVKQVGEDWRVVVRTSLGREVLIPSPPLSMEAAVEFQRRVADAILERQIEGPGGDGSGGPASRLN